MKRTHASKNPTTNAWWLRIWDFCRSSNAQKVVLGIFVIQATILAFVMHIGTPPDETNHIQFVEYYAHHSVSPIFTHQQPTYYLGDKTREPDFMYHYLMSLAYRITPLSEHYKLVVIRLVTVVLALLSFYFLAKIFRRLGFSQSITNVALLILTNLSMVLMMSAAINNDITIWLGMVGGILLLLRLMEKPAVVDLLGLALIIVWGGIFKRDLLPMSLLFGLLGIALLVKNWRIYLAGFKKLSLSAYVLLALLMVGCGLFVDRIGGNLEHYHTVTPSCEQIQGDQACSVFWISIRAKQLAQQAPQSVSPPMFVAKWIGEDTFNIINVQTQFWQRQVKPARWLTPVLTILFLIGMAYGAWYEWQQRTRADVHQNVRLYVLFIALFYTVVQLAVNYATFLHNRIFGLALNGRYVIPSVMLLVGFSCFYLSKALAGKRNLASVLAVIVVLLLLANSGLQLLLRNPQLYRGA